MESVPALANASRARAAPGTAFAPPDFAAAAAAAATAMPAAAAAPAPVAAAAVPAAVGAFTAPKTLSEQLDGLDNNKNALPPGGAATAAVNAIGNEILALEARLRAEGLSSRKISRRPEVLTLVERLKAAKEREAAALAARRQYGGRTT